MAALGFGAGLLWPLAPAHAYEFSAEERSLADNPTLNPSNSTPQWQRDAQFAEQHRQQLDRLHQSVPQFNPRSGDIPAGTGSMPYTVWQNGHASVCQRAFNSVVCR
jgi:hypothetical protein